MIITGPPGSGKTTVLKAFVQVLKESGISFELMTPTGIAAKKLANTAGHEAYTIHRRLGYKGDRWDYNNSNKYTTDVVIIDEMSMVDQEVFYRMISALYSSTKIVFVGDNDQLPSVGPGSVLKELIDSKNFKTIFLNKIFRQEKTSEIILEAKKIRDGDTDLTYFRSEKESDIWHISDRDEKRIENLIIRFAQQLKNTAKDKKKISFQIITPRNEGPLSVYSLNTALQQALNPHDPNSKELKLENSVIRVGDRVIIKKNNYVYEVFNGDVGKVIKITPYSIVVDVEDFYDTSKRIELPIKLAEDMLKLAYCLTVHKVQGSEYSIVILPLIKAHGNLLLQRNLLYTAITRAKKKVVLIGQTSAIEQAINNNKIQKRNTILAERINQWTTGTGISLRNMFSHSSASQDNKLLERLLLLEEGSS
jgi:exodeoxyribonuclease V alpha subunit